ncbi:uncharacterized protein UTRI_01565_B [Ustilago trichophora]|uniref:Mak10-domain-containing protein n=1 Tax=Ustilago trichophora TaxID=86804 RepID=A0A5C3E6C3_9BASI|nr:uncharacterized protein UTRI_01565_B [Ustilago trichophora]
MTSPQLPPLGVSASILDTQEQGANDAQPLASSADADAAPSQVRGSLPLCPGFQDATALLFSACDELRLGQMVAISNFTLMDSMAAVKIMDARMDSGMDLPASELPESDRLDNLSKGASIAEFDPFQPLAVADVLWIMDRLLACEAAWHQGSALSQTLYTCLYYHAMKSLSHKHLRFQQSSASAGLKEVPAGSATASSSTDQPPLQLVFKVLRAFILATVKTIDIAWLELTSKQNLQDGEDFSSDKNGLSLLETTDTGYVIAELEDALEWLLSGQDILQQSQVESLKARINFRKQMLYAVRLLQNPAEAAPLDVVMHTKFARRNWMHLRPAAASAVNQHAQSQIQQRSSDSDRDASKVVPLQPPNRNAAPSTASVSAFDPAYNRRLAWCQALRPISLPSPTETWRVFDGVLEELQDVVHVLQHPGFLSWKTFFTHRAIQYQTVQPLSATPYVRSLLQTAVCDRNMIASRLPLDWLTETFFQEVALIDPLLLRRASRIGRNNVEGGSQTMWNAPPPLGQRVHYFMQRVAGQLVQYLSTLSQNRARCKRTLASRLYREWVHISEEASELSRRLEACLAPSERYIPDSLFAATQHLALEVMTQITFSGFELELYGRGDDSESMWWLASRIQVEQKLVCTDLRDELSKALEACSPEQRPRRYSATILYLSRQIHLAQALEQLAISAIFLTHFFERAAKDVAAQKRPPPLSWPLDSDEDASQLELAKAIFASRIKWMRTTAPGRTATSGSSKDDDANEPLWQEYSAFRTELDATDDDTLSTLAKERLDEAIVHLQQLTSTFAGEQSQQLGARGFSGFTSSLLATARQNRNSLELALREKTVAKETTTSGTAASSISAPSAASALQAWTFEHPWIPTWFAPQPRRSFTSTA